ncbi:MAG TPA: hypothetical protein VKA46_28740 [Gemmataceae bacterium]|nr:hypothetical protein [Gemmataceae bacterium]
MRSRLFSLVVAAAGVAALVPGTASAQSRAFYRPTYGTPNGSTYHPSNFGMQHVTGYTPSNYGNPGASPLGANNFGSATAGSSIPLGSAVSLPGTPLGGGFGTSAAGIPSATNPGNLPAGMPNPGNYATPLNGAFTPGAGEPPGGTPAEGVPAPTAGVGTGPGTGSIAAGTITALPGNAFTTVGPSASPFVSPNTASMPLAPAFTPASSSYWGNPSGTSIYSPYSAFTRTTYVPTYSAPQYQSSFYAPLRRVYGSQGY